MTSLTARPNATRYLFIAIVLAAFASLPIFGTSFALVIVFLWFIYLTMAGIWNLLAGYSGLVSLGQQIFIGVGGYLLAIGSELYGLDVWLSIFMGGLVSIVCALALSIPTFRMKGVYFAIGTWVGAEAFRIWFSNWILPNSAGKAVPLGMGVFIRQAYHIPTTTLYYAALILGFATLFLSYGVLHSKLGLGLMAIRDNEVAAAGSGVDIFRTKLIVFVFGAFMTALAGGVYYMYQNFIQPLSAFSIAWTVIITVSVILGGIGTIEGPIIGALIAVLLQEYLSQYTGISLIIEGAIVIAIMLLAPRGIAGTLHKVRWYEGLWKVGPTKSPKNISSPEPSVERQKQIENQQALPLACRLTGQSRFDRSLCHSSRVLWTTSEGQRPIFVST
jgi:branched-chain amino acid transport system permease protein